MTYGMFKSFGCNTYKKVGGVAVIVNYKFYLEVRQLAAAFPPTHRFSVFANGNHLDDINSAGVD